MKGRFVLVGLITLGMTALPGSPADAQAWAGSQDLQVYAGEVFGDRLTETPLTGSSPLLNDDAVFGGRYTYNFTRQWGMQLSAGYSPSRAAHVAGGDSDLGLTTVDLDVLWNITPGFALDGHALMPYTEVGVGYAWADLHHPLYGVIGARPVVITDSSGCSANVGIGVRYYVTRSLFVALDARYRYLSRLANRYGQGLNTGETALGFGFEF